MKSIIVIILAPIEIAISSSNTHVVSIRLLQINWTLQGSPAVITSVVHRLKDRVPYLLFFFLISVFMEMADRKKYRGKYHTKMLRKPAGWPQN